jgi:hypothetical protein
MTDDLPPHPWPPGAEALYQKSLEAMMMSALLMSSPDRYTRELGLAEWAKGDFLGKEARRMVGPPRIIIVST